MKFYFIYSAGGGAGDWNGIKRVWKKWMPEYMKSKILLKFGDVFLKHASGNGIIRLGRWKNIVDLRKWLAENVDDEFIYLNNNCNILLDSGTSKLVNYISNHNSTFNCDELIEMFDEIIEENQIIEKYIDIVCNSQINSAVTFDIPNPFKIRSQNGNTRLNVIEKQSNRRLIELSAKYSNIIYDSIKRKNGQRYADSVIMTIINGTWTPKEIDLFLNKINYNPEKIAIGALSPRNINSKNMYGYLDNIKKFKFENAQQLHFLGCGGFEKVDILKESGFGGKNVSVDCSTFINRSIDGNLNGSSQSGYYDYFTNNLIRINPDTKNMILNLHEKVDNPLFSCETLETILDKILLHQSGFSSNETYNARAKLMIHNADVYRCNVEDNL